MPIVSALQMTLGDGAVLTAAEDMMGHIKDWRGRSEGQAACVALPANTLQVAKAVRLCAEHGIPVVAQGGNTSLCGGSVPPPCGTPPVVLSLSRMRRIRSIDPINNTMEVDAGCVLEAVQDAADEADRLYPVSLGAEGSCQIGGTIATNAGGTSVLRYGNTRDNVLGLEVVLPDGSIWDGLYALRKNTGYDLKHLFIGSEGTLGIITGAVLKLHPLPRAHVTAWLSVDSPAHALELLGFFQATCGSSLTAFELMNANQVSLVVEHVPGQRCPLANIECWHLLVELSDTGDADGLASAMDKVLEPALDGGLVNDGIAASSVAQRSAMWLLRHSASEANKKAGVGLTTDCAVTVSRVSTFIRMATEAVHAIIPNLPIVVVAHMGDGNVHFIPFFSFAQWDALADRDAITKRIRQAVGDTAHALGGTFSAEHGIGHALTGEMARYKPPVEISLMRAIKRAIDPAGLMNPGRVLPSSPQSP